MRAFFQGWRRKVGCITLLMACVLAAGWARSHFKYERISFQSGDSEFHWLISSHEGITWATVSAIDPEQIRRQKSLSPRPQMSFLGFEFTSFSATHFRSPLFVGGGPGHWQREFYGARVGERSYNYAPYFGRYGTTPYWLAVLILTVLSADLILRKPRREAKSNETRQRFRREALRAIQSA